MSIETWAAVMCAALVASNVYWAVTVQKLINKLMSRNYYEYLQAEALKTPSVATPPPAPEVDIEDERQARDMNAILGIY